MAVPPRFSRPPSRRGGGLTPRPGDRLPLLLAGLVVIAALALAGSLLVSVLRGFGADDSGDVASNSDPSAAPSVAVPGASTAVPGVPAASSPGTSDEGASPLGEPYVVCLDVGHGGFDLGFTRVEEVVDEETGESVETIIATESEIVLDMAFAIEERLETQGVEVVLTRTADSLVNPTGEDVNGDGEMATDGDGDGLIDTPNVDVPNNLDELQARVNICNAANANLLISLHINGAENTALQGYESWWAEGREFSAQSQWFAQEVVAQFGTQFADAGFEVESRGAQDDRDTEIPEEDLPADAFVNYVVLAPDKPERNFTGSTMPGAVVESLFLSNDSDWAVLDDPAGIDAIVNAYVSSVNAFFTEFPIEGRRLSTGESQSVDTAETRGMATPDTDASTIVSPIPVATAVAYARLPPPVETDLESSYVVETDATDRMEVALTFDCGADRGYTEQILDLLDSYGIKGSFGMTGYWAEDNADLVLRMAEEGHMIFNHTYSHGSFTGASTGAGDPGTAYRIEEMIATEELIAEITGGYDMRPYWRPPFGDYGPQTLLDMASIGYGITVMWTVDTLGWNGMTGAQVAERTLETLQPGQIVLMHVGYGAQGDFDALPAIIEGSRAEGYTFVTVEQLMQP